MESVSSSLNMNNPKLNVGVLQPPDRFYKPVLYSDRAASKMFVQTERDIYGSRSKARPLDEKKTPKSVFVFLALACLAIAFPIVKKYIKK